MPDDPAAVVVRVAARFGERLERRLAERYAVIGPGDPPGVALAPAEAARVAALVTLGSLRSDAAVFDAYPALRIVACYGTGHEGVDLAAARARGITVTYNPGANAAAVADHAMALVLASVRRLLVADRLVRDGSWRGNAQGRLPLVRGMTGRRLGVFGLGAVGSRVAARAAAFEMEVGYTGRSRREAVPYRYFASLADLADWADVLVVAARAEPETRHAVNADVLAALGPHGHVVNIARGSIVDEAALIAALAEGRIAGAGLDVFEHEPTLPAALKALPNVVLTPHNAAGTIEAQEAQQDMVVANLDAFFATGRALTPVPG